MLVWRPPSHADELALEPICAHTSTARKSDKKGGMSGMSPLDFEKWRRGADTNYFFEFILHFLREYLGGAYKKKGHENRYTNYLFEFILHKCFVNI